MRQTAGTRSTLLDTLEASHSSGEAREEELQTKAHVEEVKQLARAGLRNPYKVVVRQQFLSNQASTSGDAKKSRGTNVRVPTQLTLQYLDVHQHLRKLIDDLHRPNAEVTAVISRPTPVIATSTKSQ